MSLGIENNVNLFYNAVRGFMSVSPALALSPAMKAVRSYMNRMAFFVFKVLKVGVISKLILR